MLKTENPIIFTCFEGESYFYFVIRSGGADMYL
jgi:hypothetical protein